MRVCVCVCVCMCVCVCVCNGFIYLTELLHTILFLVKVFIDADRATPKISLRENKVLRYVTLH